MNSDSFGRILFGVVFYRVHKFTMSVRRFNLFQVLKPLSALCKIWLLFKFLKYRIYYEFG
jgi:hypothetical protein